MILLEHSTPTPFGHIIINDVTVADTLQCAHCGKHWRLKRGSSKNRTYCFHCRGITCGHPDCEKCVRQEDR